MPYINFFGNNLGRILYWVGGTGTWNTTAGLKWSLTSGGIGGEPIPTELDTVIFDGYSNGNIISYNVGTNPECLNLFVIGFGGTINANAATIDIYGSLIYSDQMSYSSTVQTGHAFLATSGTHYIKTGGFDLRASTFDGDPSVTWILLDDYLMTGAFTLVSGYINTNDQDVTMGGFESTAANLRGLILGSSTIYVHDDWDISSNASTFTLDEGTSTINLTDNPNHGFWGGEKDYYNVIISAAAGDNLISQRVYDSNTYVNLTLLGTAGGSGFNDGVGFYTDQTITGTFKVTGKTATQRFLVSSIPPYVQVTISAAVVDIDKADFVGINATGASSWNISAAPGFTGDCGGNTGITFTSPENVYWVGGTGDFTTLAEWSSSSGGSGGNSRVPIVQDTGVFDGNSFAGAGLTVTMNTSRYPSFDFSAVTNNPTISKTLSGSCYGDLILGTMSLTGVSDWSMRGRGSQIIQTNGAVWGGSGSVLDFDSATGTYTFLDDFSSIDDIEIKSGTVDFNDFNITADRILIDGTFTTVVNMGSGTFTLTDTGIIWSVAASNVTLNAETSVISSTNTSASNKTFTGGGKTYNNLSVSGLAAAGTFTIEGSNSWSDTTFAANANIRLTASTTQTINGTCAATGTLGNGIVVRSTSATNATISSANNVNWDFVTLTDLTGTGGGVFTATNSTDGGGNIGWLITP